MILGGGGFRVPLLIRALAGHPFDVTLVDDDDARLATIQAVIADLGLPAPAATTDLAVALPGADFVFTAVRVGGTAGRALDEELALRHGLLGQETVGAGGMAYALRTLPVMRQVARQIARLAPDAWTVNFTNPAGIVTQAMREALGERVIGICDTPIGLVNRLVAVMGGAGDAAVDAVDYVGLNHLGWLRAVHVGGRELVGEALADPQRLAALEEAELFGADLLRSVGALPNEYLFYYYFHREAVARIRARTPRGVYLARQQEAFYAAAGAAPQRAGQLWRAALAEREATYGSETRGDPASRRPEEEIALGGYQQVALELMLSLSGLDPRPRTMILNVGNAHAGGRAIPQLPDDAVVEVPLTVSPRGLARQPLAEVPIELAGLMAHVKASDALLLRATARRDPVLAVRAFAEHPLVDSVASARELLRELAAAEPLVAAAVGVDRMDRLEP